MSAASVPCPDELNASDATKTQVLFCSTRKVTFSMITLIAVGAACLNEGLGFLNVISLEVDAQKQKDNELVNITKLLTATESPNSATGVLFDNKKIREYSGKLLANSDYLSNHHRKIDLIANRCKQWGVVTTIFDPTDALSRVASLSSWCLVIVADQKTPNNFMSMFKALQENKEQKYQANMDRVVYLSVEKQRKWHTEVGHGPFASYVQSIPWNHFSRKNLGYLFVRSLHFYSFLILFIR